ncbi:MAG: threonine/serine exporter family protein [Planctomycetota bacterium]
MRASDAGCGAPNEGPGGAEARRVELEFLLETASQLHAYGTPAHRLERVLVQMADHLGHTMAVFSTPTSIMLAFGAGVDQRPHLMRVEPGDVNLGKLVEFDELLEDVEARRVDVPSALAALRALSTAPERYGVGWSVLAFGLASATAARFFGGGLVEVLASLALGVVIGVLGRYSQREPGVASIFEPISGFLAAFAGLALRRAGVEVDDRIVALAGIIVLVPGLTLTVALIELATRHLASGTARLAGASAVFLTIGLGAALGRFVGERVLGITAATGEAAPGEPFGWLTDWTQWLALAVAPLAFVVLFRARRQEVGVIFATGVIGFLAARIASSASNDPAVGSFLGALVVGLLANLYARRVDRPATVPMLPGILMLVPGSLGYRALDAFVSHNALRGVETAFLMLLVAISLVGGLLTANAVLPPRRVL